MENFEKVIEKNTNPVIRLTQEEIKEGLECEDFCT